MTISSCPFHSHSVYAHNLCNVSDQNRPHFSSTVAEYVHILLENNPTSNILYLVQQTHTETSTANTKSHNTDRPCKYLIISFY